MDGADHRQKLILGHALQQIGRRAGSHRALDSPSLSDVVSMMTRALGASPRIATRASVPLVQGSRRSISVISGSCRRNSAIPSAALAAWATSGSQPHFARSSPWRASESATGSTEFRIAGKRRWPGSNLRARDSACGIDGHQAGLASSTSSRQARERREPEASGVACPAASR